MRRWASALSLVCLLGGSSCLSRDVVEQTPNTSNVFIERVPNSSINQIDLLFVIDNSTSMADKQEILKKAVPQMVRRLVNPRCQNEAGEFVQNDGACPAGYSPEFRAVTDIHIGVISSSLGDHGRNRACARDTMGRNNDDRALLMPKVREGLVDPEGTGFLSWSGGGVDQVNLLVDQFASHVEATREFGCGYEAPLEAFYRFLIDPAPPFALELNANENAEIARDANGNMLIDHDVLTQRAAFLRPEGLVAIVILTDENDCSAMDGGETYDYAGVGHLVGQPPSQGMPIAAPICETNPNDRCCHSCFVDAPAGCDQNACVGTPRIPAEENRDNTRCFANRKRFGLDLLYPIQRYVDGLTKTTVRNDRTGEEVNNPLLRGAGPENEGILRAQGRVFLAGIVGVPWQDIATDDSLSDPAVMKYRSAAQLRVADLTVGEASATRWDLILGEPGLPANSPQCKDGADGRCGAAPVLPLDPFMIESVDPRPIGMAHPITGDLIVGFDSNNPQANAINGHEVNHNVQSDRVPDDFPARDDLQYACTFPLEQPKENCTEDDYSCDCGDEPSRNRPLCQAPGAGAPATTTQYFGKAYPGTRILQVLKEFGDNSIVGSICPKITQGSVEDPNYGYNPAVQAIVDQLAIQLKGTCLPRELSVEESGSVPCAVVETMRPDVGTLDCGALGRDDVPEAIRPAVLEHLRDSEICGDGTQVDCEDMQMCAIEQLLTEGRDQCLFDKGDAAAFPHAGFCYIDPTKQDEDGNYVAGGDENGNNPIVEQCPRSTERRLLRFVGPETPAANTVTFVACTGDAQSKDIPIPSPPSESEEGEGDEASGM